MGGANVVGKHRVVRVLLIVLGALLVGYALADHPLYGGEPGYGKAEWAIGGVGAAIALAALLPLKFGEAVLLFALSGFFALGVVELAAENLLGARFRPIYQADDALIFSMIPGGVSEHIRSPANGGGSVIHRINSAGLRGPELLPAGQATRIVVYGDSFIHAYYTPDEQTFVTRLGARLAERMRREVEVVNAGVSSYGPDQISLKMARELPLLRPDLVVVAIFAGNDYGDLLRNKLFRLTPDGRLETAEWSLDPALRLAFDVSQRESLLKRALREAMRAWQPQSTESFSDPDALLAEAEREYRSYQSDGIVTNAQIDYYSADISLAPDRESSRLKVRLMAAVLERIRQVAQSNGVPLAFMFIPHPGDLPGEYDSWHVDRSRFPQYDGRRQTALLEEMGRALGVPSLNLYAAFSGHDPNALYLRGDDHWNERGQELAAEAMAALLLDRGLLVPSP